MARGSQIGAVVAAALLVLAPAPVSAQQAEVVVVDTIAVEGISRVPRETVLGALAITPPDSVRRRALAEAEKRLWALGQFSDLRIFLRDLEGGGTLLRVVVVEAPTVRRVLVQGLENADEELVTDSAGVRPASPYRPENVFRAREILRDRLADEGIPFARIETRQVAVEGLPNVVDLVIEVEEGHRVTVADVVVEGNERMGTDDIVGAMNVRPEGFWWFRSGTFDQDQYENDLTAGIPQLYRSRGFLDAEVLSDTLVIDPETGKARVELQVVEGEQYRVGQLSIDGNSHFEDERLEGFFLPERGGILRSLGISGAAREEATQGRVFDQVAFEAAIDEIRQLYYNDGYIFAQIEPFIQKGEVEGDADPTVSVGLRINEGQPAYINRINIEGNDYTHERVIRDRIAILPGDVYSQDRVIQSYQSINGLGFFESPMPFPDVQVNPDDGTVDITFQVQERNTGAVNFGTSVGGGIGLAGFIGYDQPNLFGQAKEGHLRWDFGRYVNNFTVSYSDPSLFRTRTSGTISLFNARDRFFSFNSGERRRIGGSLRFGFPVPGSRYARMFAGYSLSRTKYRLRQGVDDTSLFGRAPGTQSQFSLGITRTTLNHPIFPVTGSRMSWDTQFNGGILGGDGDFIRHLAEASWWLPLGQAGGTSEGGGGVTFALGASFKGGAIFGNPDNFPFDRFWMGGVQFGQALRGYDETSVTPFGFFPENSRTISDIDRLGDAFMSVTAELAMRLNNSISVSTFFDAGNVWREPGDIDTSRLFRGAGVGLQLVTPFGPIGLDYAYGFDKTVPGWQLHFRMGPGY